MVISRPPPPMQKHHIPVWDQLVALKNSKGNANAETTSESQTKTQTQPSNSNSNNSTTALFVGRKSGGKTTLIERFLNPSKEDFPKSTVALDYKFARQHGLIAHLYDCSSIEYTDVLFQAYRENFQNLCGNNNQNYVPQLMKESSNQKKQSTSMEITNVSNIISTSHLCVIILDGEDPSSCLTNLLQWSAQLRGRYVSTQNMMNQANSNANITGRPDVLLHMDHYPDLDVCKPFPVPLLVVLSKYDKLISQSDAEVRKLLVRALRFFTHVFCGHFLAVSVQEKSSLTCWRGLLKALLFNEFQQSRDKMEQVRKEKEAKEQENKENKSSKENNSTTKAAAAPATDKSDPLSPPQKITTPQQAHSILPQGVKVITDMTKPYLSIPAGFDSTRSIGPPVGGSQINPNSIANDPSIWQRSIEQFVGSSSASKATAINTNSSSVAVDTLTDDELKQFPETSIDSMVLQKGDEFRDYKRRAETRLRMERGRVDVS